MGLIHIDLFATLDLVAQAPGGPGEDTEGGFKFGGCQAPFPDEVVGQQVVCSIARMDALLLGRKTNEIFAGYWPHQDDGVDSEIAGKSNLISEIRRLTQQTESRVGRFVAARIRCCDIDTRNSKSTRERPRDRQHQFRADTALRTTLRSIEFVPVSNRSRLRQEGFRQRKGAVESDASRTCVDSPTGAVLLHYELTSDIRRMGDMTRETDLHIT